MSVLVTSFVILILDVHWSVSVQSKGVFYADFVFCLFEIQSGFAQYMRLKVQLIPLTL